MLVDDLLTLMWHCTKNRQISVMEITAGAQKHLKKCRLKLYHARRCEGEISSLSQTSFKMD